jgi:hypothetical protein
VAPELFYVFRPKDSRNSLEVMKKKHLYSKAVDAYSVGMLASQFGRTNGTDRCLKMLRSSMVLD